MMSKANNGSGNNITRDLWETRQEFWNKLNEQYNFKFDCCASINNRKTEIFSDNFENVIKVNNTAWMNPPFSKSKVMFEHFFKVVKQGVAIYRCDNMETKVWQDIIFPNASWIFIPSGRISYTSFEIGKMRKVMGSRFPSALIGFNLPLLKNFEGNILKIIK